VNHPIPLVDLKAQYEPIKDEIMQAWGEVLDGMRLFLGPNVQAFEREFAAYCGTDFGLGVADGTNAIHLALRACEIGPGDEVITVAHTFMATVESILLAGARPVFVDVEPDTLLMDPAQIEAAITPQTRAILPVHLYGQVCDMDPILEIARRHKLYVIEDACQAHGAEYKGQRAGSIGDIAGFSFYFSKNLGGYGEGGMVTTSNEGLRRRVKMLRDHGSENRYYHDMVGWNGRLDELQAAALRIKLRRLEGWNDLRQAHATRYNELLKDIVVTPTRAEGRKHVYHLYVIRTGQREALRRHLNELGIGTGIHYPVPCHLQRAVQELGYRAGSLPVTEAAAEEILSLPMYAELTDEQIERVAEAVVEFIKQPV